MSDMLQDTCLLLNKPILSFHSVSNIWEYVYNDEWKKNVQCMDNI